MTHKNPTVMAASIKQRLLNFSRENHTDFNTVLRRFGIERLLYRLSTSPHSKYFVLKGAMLLKIWGGNDVRPTRDLDLLGKGEATPGNLSKIFEDICKKDTIPPDGLQFRSESISVEEIRETDEYAGQRVSIEAFLGKARISLQIDIGFGDIIYPQPKVVEFPAVLNLPAPRIKAYPPESVIAEKFEIIVKRGFANSRIKDYYDIWWMSRHFDFDGGHLCRAIQKTLKRRKTILTPDTPSGLTSEFGTDPDNQTRWAAFLKRSNLTSVPKSFATVVKKVADFLAPCLDAIR